MPGRPRSVKRRSDTASTAWVDARLVLEGTVERVGNRLRVTARLSSTDDDVMQWADVYDRAEKTRVAPFPLQRTLSRGRRAGWGLRRRRPLGRSP
ncbi:MAG: hypothetical protein ABI408_01285 [Gemmatimonadaceae bacterium]